MNFNELGLNADLIKALDDIGYKEPTKIQFDVISEANNGKNIIGQSQTGTGKTAAFVLSLLQNIDLNKRGTQALIIAPTRELVTQIKDEIFKLSKYHRVKSLAVFGGSPIYKQIDLIRKGQDIVIGTPGRVIDLIERKVLKLEHINYFVLDEVDRMLDMGFIDDIDFIWSGLTNLKQVFSFSATITPAIKTIIEKYLGINYTFIKSTDAITTEKIDHSFLETPMINKYELLNKFIKKHKSEKTIVFVQMKVDTEKLAMKLNEDGFKASFLNGDMRQRERFKALKDFQEGLTNIFVVTDVAARGLNMKNIELVVNYDVPTDPESYIHRIGRTGRAGAEGKAIMFVSGGEKYAFKNIEKTNKITIKQVNTEGEEIERKEERSTSRGSFGGRGRAPSRFGSRSRSEGSSRGGTRYGSSRSGSSEKKSYGFSAGRSERKPYGERAESSEKKSFGEKSFSGERKSFGEKRTFSDREPVGDKNSSFRKSDSEKTFEHKSSGYFAKRDEKRGQRSTTRGASSRPSSRSSSVRRDSGSSRGGSRTSR
ncbi:MAG: DEAD/DEAH box helicase [Candidatus Gracilibacteria bacterium]|nr:DEAD/DEAH box helicase [Candidatus Gracilibacteria bacterium]